MSKTISPIKRAIKVALKETFHPSPQRFRIGSKSVVCTLCGNDGFHWHGHGTLGSRYKALLVEGYALQCCDCSHLEFFGKRPEEQE